MADIISFADWQALQALIKEGNAAVSGMTAAEAQAALGASENSGLYTYQANTAAGANNVINFPNAATAAEAADEYVAAGGTTSSAGAATAATGAAETVANLTVIKGGAAGTSGVAGLLAMPLPTAAAAIAPLAGVALGVGLYELNPEFWTKISKALLPFCYDDSELLPVTVDSNGQAYFPQGAVDALKELFETEIQISQEVISSDLTPPYSHSPKNPVPFAFTDITNVPFSLKWSNASENRWDSTIRVTTEGSKVYAIFYCNEASTSNYKNFFLMFLSDGKMTFNELDKRGLYSIKPDYIYNDSSGSNSVYKTYNGSYIGPFYTQLLVVGQYLVGHELISSINFTNIWDNVIAFAGSGYLTGNSAWAYAHSLFHGVIESTSGQTGVTNWKGQQVPDGTSGINVLTGFDADGNPIYTPYYPVQIPIGDPGVSANPEEQPNPVAPSTNPAIDPYISPVPDPSKYPENVPVSPPAPLPNPVPSPQPVPGPSTDPSQDPDDGGVPDDPTPPKDPTDTGDTPTPTIPIIPILPSSATGLLHVYNPTQAQIDQFGSWLWTTFSGDLIDTLSKLFNDPMDAVIGLHELYATPATSGDTTIKAGYLDSGVSSKLVGSRYTTINCGSVVVEEYYQNYLDYSPYTQCYIYLPFIGIVTVSADDIIGNAVNIVYHIDSYTGCCIAVITVAKKGYSSTVYQFEGNCAVEIPITSGYQSTMMAGLMGVAGTAISGNPTVGLHAAHIGRAGLGKNSVQHSGSFGASYGAMGVKIPYIIVKRPTQKIVTNYSVSYGYPAHKMVYVGNCTGYLRAKEVRVTSTTATNIEKEMIVSALKAGIYVK
jgi:hypothetical protein